MISFREVVRNLTLNNSIFIDKHVFRGFFIDKHVFRASDQGLIEQRYRSGDAHAGWFFSDESSIAHGPYLTREGACEELELYAQWLTGDLRS